jgi:hypothetical protein
MLFQRQLWQLLRNDSDEPISLLFSPLKGEDIENSLPFRGRGMPILSGVERMGVGLIDIERLAKHERIFCDR